MPSWVPASLDCHAFFHANGRFSVDSILDQSLTLMALGETGVVGMLAHAKAVEHVEETTVTTRSRCLVNNHTGASKNMDWSVCLDCQMLCLQDDCVLELNHDVVAKELQPIVPTVGYEAAHGCDRCFRSSIVIE